MEKTVTFLYNGIGHWVKVYVNGKDVDILSAYNTIDGVMTNINTFPKNVKLYIKRVALNKRHSEDLLLI